MKVLLKKKVCGFREQCMEPIEKTKKCQFTFSKKIKIKRLKRRCEFVSTVPNGY